MGMHLWPWEGSNDTKGEAAASGAGGGGVSLQGLGSLPSPKQHARPSPWVYECLPDLWPLWATWLACWEFAFCPRQPQGTWVPSPPKAFCAAWRKRVGDRARGVRAVPG